MITKEKMISIKNHRVVVTRHGGPDVLQMVEEDRPARAWRIRRQGGSC